MNLKYDGPVTTDYLNEATGETFHVVPGCTIAVSDDFGAKLLASASSEFSIVPTDIPEKPKQRGAGGSVREDN